MTRRAPLVLAAAAFAAVTALVAAGATASLDAAALEAAQRLASRSLDVAGSLLTLAGRVEPTSVVALVLAAAGYRRDGVRGLVPLLMFAGMAIELVLKVTLAQPAPPHALGRDLALLTLPSLGPPYAYPSGHELRATFLSLLIAPAGAWRAAAWAFVVAMGATRVYLAEHWLSDVVGGLLLGLALVLVARRPG